MKTLGFSLSIISILIFGFYYSYQSTYRINDLREFKKILIVMKNEIIFLKTPLNELIEHMQYKSSMHYLFEAFSNELKEEKEDIYEMWECAIEKSKNKYYFQKEDLEMIGSFGKAFGKSMDTKISIMENIIEYINNKIFEINEEKIKDLKLYKSLSILVSGLIIILFW